MQLTLTVTNIMEIILMALDKEKENMFSLTEINIKVILKLIENMESEKSLIKENKKLREKKKKKLFSLDNIMV